MGAFAVGRRKGGGFGIYVRTLVGDVLGLAAAAQQWKWGAQKSFPPSLPSPPFPKHKRVFSEIGKAFFFFSSCHFNVQYLESLWKSAENSKKTTVHIFGCFQHN